MPLTAGGSEVLGATCISGLTTVDVTVPVQCDAAGQVGSPPPDTVAELTAVVLAAAVPTATGTVMTTDPFTFVAIVQPASVEPETGQLVNTPLGAVGTPLNVMPVGITSEIVIGAVVGPFVTEIVIV